ncbi:MAG: ABC transporter substrate-binding protein [Chloroflexota bacterium]|nr:ABC transporter substrate-binding protein [Chloroflexota bacterium]
MQKKHVWILLLVALLAVACGGTVPATTEAEEGSAAAVAEESPASGVEGVEQPVENTDTGTEELELVRVGIVPVTIYAPFFIALDKGYFAEAGLDVELMPVEGGTENVVQLAAGNFEVAGGGIGAGLLNAAARGVEFEIVAPMHTERPPLTSPFVVSRERYESGELTEMSDLAGKVVSTNSKGSATEYWLWRALQQGGLDFDDVEVIGVGFREVAAALESGTLHGAILGEPLVTFAEQEGLVTRLSEDFLDGVTPTVVLLNEQWATNNPELAQGFVTAFLRGARDLNGEGWYDPENLAIIEEYTGIPADIVAEANRSYHDPNGTVPVEDLQTLQDFFMEQGELNYDEPLDLTPFINTTYAEQAVEELGGPVEWEE